MTGLKPRKQPTQPRAVETVARILAARAQILLQSNVRTTKDALFAINQTPPTLCRAK
jgi:hypothetical protein